MSNNCPRFGKWIGGCRFEPRYDEPTIASILNGGMWSSASFKIDGKNMSLEDISPTKKYIRDVCIRCGKTVERPKA